jgi:CubicO group peptidase (beta-lactamase class C family)
VAQGRFPGGQLVVRHRGEVVLDVAVGVARGFRPEEQSAAVPVTPTTRFALFSASKPVVAVAVAMLEEENSIDVNAPVAKYWPAFGKPEITVLDVLTHRACVMTPELINRPRDWGDEEKVRAALIEAKPKWKRGTLAYMPYEFGWILAEVVRGATGRSLESFIQKRIPQVRFGARREELGELARAYWQGGKVIVAGNDLSQSFEEANNLPEVLTAFVPAAGLVCTARELASFYDALIQGKLIKLETLRRYTTGFGYELDKSNRIPLRMARGFLLGSFTPSIYGWWGTQHVFGHAGAFCTLGWGEVERQLAVAIVTNGNRGPYESLMRFAPIGSAIRRAVKHERR